MLFVLLLKYSRRSFVPFFKYKCYSFSYIFFQLFVGRKILTAGKKFVLPIGFPFAVSFNEIIRSPLLCLQEVLLQGASDNLLFIIITFLDDYTILFSNAMFFHAFVVGKLRQVTPELLGQHVVEAFVLNPVLDRDGLVKNFP